MDRFDDLNESERSIPTIGFTRDEIGFLIKIINESSFKGSDIVIVSSLFNKLVSLYNSL